MRKVNIATLTRGYARGFARGIGLRPGTPGAIPPNAMAPASSRGKTAGALAGLILGLAGLALIAPNKSTAQTIEVIDPSAGIEAANNATGGAINDATNAVNTATKTAASIAENPGDAPIYADQSVTIGGQVANQAAGSLDASFADVVNAPMGSSVNAALRAGQNGVSSGPNDVPAIVSNTIGGARRNIAPSWSEPQSAAQTAQTAQNTAQNTVQNTGQNMGQNTTLMGSNIQASPYDTQPSDSGQSTAAAQGYRPMQSGNMQSAEVQNSSNQIANATNPNAQADGANADTYRKDDLIGAATGVFGKGAQGVAGLIEKLLADQGEPNGYIVGREAGGAFVVGARYGSGTLHHKVEGERPVYWTGPSIGIDAGANAGTTFVLVYNLFDTEDLYKRFPAGEGHAYFIGGMNASYLRRGDIVLIPIRVGAGARLGINAGYLKFSPKQNWFPF